MYKSIIVPLDGSTFGEHALPAAMSIARRAGATLTLVHVHAPLKATYLEGAAFVDDTIEDEIREQQREYLQIIGDRVGKALGGLTLNTRLVDGSVADTIVNEAAKNNADLLVMTTHGRSVFGRMWLGSVTDRLVRRLSIPLLLIHPNEISPDLNVEPTWKHMLIPLDGTELAEQILKPALALGQLTTADYTLARIVRPVLPVGYTAEVTVAGQAMQASMEQVELIQKRLLEQAHEYLDEIGGRIGGLGQEIKKCVDIEQQPAVAILEEAKKNDIDVIAIATHGRSGITRLFLGSVADKVIRGTNVPVLIYRPVEKK